MRGVAWVYIHVVGIVDTLTAVEVVSHLPCRSGKYVFATHLRRSPSMCVVMWGNVHGYLRGVTDYLRCGTWFTEVTGVHLGDGGSLRDRHGS